MTISLNFLLNSLFTLSGLLLLITGIIHQGVLGALDLLIGGIMLAVTGAGMAIRRRWI